MKPIKKTIELTFKFPFGVTLPFLTPIIRRYKNLSNKRKRLIKAIAILLAVGVVTLIVSQQIEMIAQKNGSTANKKYSGKLITTPDYKTILPAGKTIESFGGWTRVSPPQSNPVFAYVDSINGKQVTVSEQPLPAEFKQDTNAQIQHLASSYNATDKVTVGNVTVFIGTSATGPQSVIFVKNNLLVLVKTSVTISDDEWAGYVNGLK